MNDTLTSPPGHATTPRTEKVGRGRLEAIDMARFLTGPGAYALQLLMVVAVGWVLVRTGRRGTLETGMSTLAATGAAAVGRRGRRD
ncbi:hypothetical protein ACH0CV_11170 [Brachybacterium paraconglomeratum]|uniref:hypothetical protein n=1 Tax=Brachybacterium paraconglomeratum TaxID=173362 RepID=UPI003879EC3C